jgi:hypothetical protein
MSLIENNDWKIMAVAPILSLCDASKALAQGCRSLPDRKESAMANQEFPLIALHHGAALLGDTMLPYNRAGYTSRAPSNAGSAQVNTGLSLLDRLDAWFLRQRQRADEAYLAQSQDVFELESRMRAIERGVGGRYY